MKEQLDKYFAGTLTDTEKLNLFREMDHDAVLKDDMADMQNLMALSGLMDKEDDHRLAAEKMKELERMANKRKVLRVARWVMKYAAVAVLLFCTWFLSEKYTLEKHQDEAIWIEAPQGQRVYLTLADGTEAWLSSRTKMKVPNQFNNKERVVELDGEGFFAVKKDAKRPFIVKTKQYNVQVLGTQFNVFAYSGSRDFETDLLEGSVYVYHKDDTQRGLYLKPDEKVYLKDGKLLKSMSNFKQSKYLKNGVFTFEDKPFGELLTRLELWYDVKFTVAKPAIRDYVFSGKFRQSDEIQSILQAIQEVGKFNFRIITENEIEIY